MNFKKSMTTMKTANTESFVYFKKTSATYRIKNEETSVLKKWQ